MGEGMRSGTRGAYIVGQPKVGGQLPLDKLSLVFGHSKFDNIVLHRFLGKIVI
jgi:hypothetical protein